MSMIRSSFIGSIISIPIVIAGTILMLPGLFIVIAGTYLEKES